MMADISPGGHTYCSSDYNFTPKPMATSTGLVHPKNPSLLDSYSYSKRFLSQIFIPSSSTLMIFSEKLIQLMQGTQKQDKESLYPLFNPTLISKISLTF